MESDAERELSPLLGMVANPGAIELGIQDPAGGGYSEDEPNNELASHMVAGGRWLEA